MRGLRGLRQLGWRVAVVYLLGSLSPSLAAPISVNFADLSVLATHETDVWTDEHQHTLTSSELVSHSHNLTSASDEGADQDRHDDRHARCCGSALCFSAVSPETPTLLQFGTLRSRCEATPDLTVDAVRSVGSIGHPSPEIAPEN